ncbi:MAG: hypothetical protein EBV03_04785 [Proteobacteria bacterium]|nr:hypothetical protein [Pseudomonadota bacterium]
MAPVRQSRQFLILAGILLLALCLPFWLAQLRYALDPSMYDADMSVMFAFSRYYDPELFAGDYIADYYISLWIPLGYEWLHRAWARLDDPAHLLIWLRACLWLAPLPAAWVAGYRLGGRMNAVATVILYSTSVVFLRRSSGGMPHSFGYPLLWWGIAALLSGRPYQLAMATVLSALFYPIVTPVLGVTLALWLLLPGWVPRVPQQAALLQAALWKKLLWLSVPALISLGFIAAMLSGTAVGYGKEIDAHSLLRDYPEAGYIWAVVEPLEILMLMYRYQFFYPFGWEGSIPVVKLMLGLLLLGALLLDRRDRRPTGLRPYLIATGLGLGASWLFAYDHAYRFMSYCVPPLVTLYTPLVMRRFAQLLLPRRAQSLGFIAALLLFVGSHSKPDANLSGFYMQFEPRQMRALEFIRTLPKSAMLAGWPAEDWGGIAHAVPVISQRKALVTLRTHALGHHDYVMEMRRRTYAIIDAYLAQDLAPLLRLRDEFAVDYLIVNAQDYGDNCYTSDHQTHNAADAPKYFEPFDTYTREKWTGSPQCFLPLTLEKAAVYAQDNIYILDLHKLGR